MDIITKTEIFNGKPAQFFAVLKEYQVDELGLEEGTENDAGVTIRLIDPTRTIYVPHPYAPNGLPERESLLLPDSPRVVVRITRFTAYKADITAIQDVASSTTLTFRTDAQKFEYTEPVWLSITNYMRVRGWISDAKAPQKIKRGRKSLACNVWLDIMISEKSFPVGSNSSNNELFQMWKKLWSLETGKDADNPDDLADPWRSYTAAAGKK